MLVSTSKNSKNLEIFPNAAELYTVKKLGEASLWHLMSVTGNS